MADKKFGTFLGVITPNVTIMFGVILFLRLGLITANVGLTTTIIIIAISTLLVLITCLSIGSIISSMHTIGSGGVYYLVSRTLGIEIGGALGIVIFISQLLLISFTANAFSYLLQSIYPDINVRIVEVLTITSLATFSSYSAHITLKLQVVILAVILAAVGAVFLGNPSNLNPVEYAKPFYHNMEFWLAFAMFFPALTGIESGMSLSGTLKDPARSLLSGNIISLVLVSAVYAALAVFIFYNVPHDALAADPFVLTKYACSKKIMLAGISTAALSGTIGALINGPRTLQIMAEDGIVPKFLADVYGKYDEPRYALLGTTILSIILSVTTNLERIIPILTMNCLIIYGLLNFISGINTLMNTANWRPKFKTHYIISFVGLSMVIVFMFMINAGWSFTSLFILSICCLLLHKRNINTPFSDIRNSIVFFFSRNALYKLAQSSNSSNIWHPILLVLTVNPIKYMRLAQLTNNIADQNGILIFGSVLPEDTTSPERLNSTQTAIHKFLNNKNIKALTEVNFFDNTTNGFINYIKSYGVGPMQPNTIVLPIENKQDINNDLFELLYNCNLHQKNIVLFQDGVKFKEKISSIDAKHNNNHIDLWWDSSARESINLAINLATLLQSTNDWRKAKINIKCIVNSVNAVQNMKEYLEKFVTINRLEIDVYVFLEDEKFDLQQAINKYSQDAIISFIPLLYQKFDQEQLSSKQCQDYLSKLISINNQYGARILCCAPNIFDYQNIYSYPNKRIEPITLPVNSNSSD